MSEPCSRSSCRGDDHLFDPDDYSSHPAELPRCSTRLSPLAPGDDERCFDPLSLDHPSTHPQVRESRSHWTDRQLRGEVLRQRFPKEPPNTEYQSNAPRDPLPYHPYPVQPSDLPPEHPLSIVPPDYRNPLSDDAPLDAEKRARWLEERGYDPKAEDDLMRSDGEGCIINGEFVGEMPVAEKDLIRDGIEYDECPDLPRIPREFNVKPRWESFCRLYAFGHSAADAARHAGYAWGTARHAGWRLLQDPRIRRRIRMLQEFAHENRPKTREELGVRLETVYREAMNRGQYHAAIKSLDLIARLEGIRPPARDPLSREKDGEPEEKIREKSDAPEGA